MRNTWLSFEIDDDVKNSMWLSTNTVESHARAMKKRDLHITTVFFGKKLKGLNVSRLVKINTLLRKITAKYLDKDLTLKFKCFRLFPPGKKNLIVAEYHKNQNVEDLVVEIKSTIPEASDNFVGFTPHITMGRVNRWHKIEDCLNSIPAFPDLDLKGIEWCGDHIKYMDERYKLEEEQ